jgi:RNA polymerase sigma-70 factor, ECF subfamily
MLPERPLFTDADLLERILGGDTELYELLVERYQERLYRFALGSVREPDAAADLVQDTLVKAYASLSSCRDRDRFGAWLFRILRNRCIDYRKEHRRRDVPLDDRTAFSSSSGLPDHDAERAQLRDQLEKALATLPDGQREAFLLKHVHGMGYDEIAELLGVGTSALKMRVARAREALQSVLSTQWYEREKTM